MRLDKYLVTCLGALALAGCSAQEAGVDYPVNAHIMASEEFKNAACRLAGIDTTIAITDDNDKIITTDYAGRHVASVKSDANVFFACKDGTHDPESDPERSLGDTSIGVHYNDVVASSDELKNAARLVSRGLR